MVSPHHQDRNKLEPVLSTVSLEQLNKEREHTTQRVSGRRKCDSHCLLSAPISFRKQHKAEDLPVLLLYPGCHVLIALPQSYLYSGFWHLYFVAPSTQYFDNIQPPLRPPEDKRSFGKCSLLRATQVLQFASGSNTQKQVTFTGDQNHYSNSGNQRLRKHTFLPFLFNITNCKSAQSQKKPPILYYLLISGTLTENIQMD